VLSWERARNPLPCHHGNPAAALATRAVREYARRMSSARLTILVIALTATAFVLAAVEIAGSLSQRAIGILTMAALLAAASTAVAIVVERRKPTGWLGPVLALTGFLPAVALLGDVFKRGPLGEYAVALSQGSWVLLFLAPALLVLFFPEGHLRGRDRWLAGAIVADALLFITLGAMWPDPYPAPYARSPHVFGTMPHALAVAIVAITLPGVLITLILTAGSLVRRYRRSSSELREQMRWLALGGMLLPLTLLVAWAGYVTVNLGDAFVFVGLGLAAIAIPGVIGIAVVRPDLFDVDRALAATALHAAVTLVVLAIFTAASFGAGILLPGDSVVAAVAATSLCALLLVPLRVRLQGRVDRWFYPARRAALAAIEELSRQTASTQARPEELEALLQRVLADPTLGIGVVSGGGADVVDLGGHPLRIGATSAPVVLGGERVGLITTSRTSRELLRDIASKAAPIVEVIRLRLGLQQALRDAEASRARLLRAGYEERQRLERDLHDGAQLRLVSLGMALRVAQRNLSHGAVDVNGLLDQAVAELGTAVSELRQLAHGIRPSCLDDGLAPALSVLVDSVPIPVDMRVAEAPMDGDLQTTAYYVASEAIANAVKHSRADRIALEVAAQDGDLYVRVKDDGVGGAVARDGCGLARLADRVSAHGGRLFVSSPRDGGTTVEAILPCVS
jgi:signal transduction histidine kinase